MNEKLKGLMNKKITLGDWREDTEGFLTNFLVLVALSFPMVELVAVMLGHIHEFMVPLLWFITLVGVIILIVLGVNGKFKGLYLSDVFLMLSIVFTVISIIFSKSLLITFTGSMEYFSEDPFQVLGYFVIFFMASQVTSYENRKKLIVALLVVAVFHTIPAILQHMQLWPFRVLAEEPFNPSSGLTQHFNFYGAIAILFAGLTCMIFLMKNTKKYYLWYFAALMCFVTAMFSGSRLTWVGLAASFCFVLVMELYQKIKGVQSMISAKRYIVLMISFAVICFLLVMFDNVITSQVNETARELGGDVTNMGTGRMNMWMVGLECVKDYPFTGVGFDNFVYCYKAHPEYNHGWIGHKAHNEYLQIFVTQGVFSGINYLAMCLYTVLFGIKRMMTIDEETKQKATSYILLVMLVGFFCQALFNNSATNISPYKWMIMGLILSRCKQKSLKKNV